MDNYFYFQTTENGHTNFRSYAGMSLQTVEELLADMGITVYSTITKEEFETGLSSQS